MQLTLNIYNGGEIEKTYQTDTYGLTFGVLEDFLAMMDLDTMSDAEALNVILRMLKELKPTMKEIFPELTDAELRRTKISEVIDLFLNLFRYAMEEVGGLAGGSKN